MRREMVLGKVLDWLYEKKENIRVIAMMRQGIPIVSGGKVMIQGVSCKGYPIYIREYDPVTESYIGKVYTPYRVEGCWGRYGRFKGYLDEGREYKGLSKVRYKRFDIDRIKRCLS